MVKARLTTNLRQHLQAAGILDVVFVHWFARACGPVRRALAERGARIALFVVGPALTAEWEWPLPADFIKGERS